MTQQNATTSTSFLLHLSIEFIVTPRAGWPLLGTTVRHTLHINEWVRDWRGGGPGCSLLQPGKAGGYLKFCFLVERERLRIQLHSNLGCFWQFQERLQVRFQRRADPGGWNIQDQANTQTSLCLRHYDAAKHQS